MDKYQEALERAKKEYQNADGISREILERTFPELIEETDDERLRKTTISFLEEFKKKGYENAVECIEWLEKQGPIFKDSEQRDPWEYIEKFKKLYGHYPKDADEIGVIVSEMVKKHSGKPLEVANKQSEWKEEDDRIIAKILSICNDFKKSFEISPASAKVIQKDIDRIDKWLKSLNPLSRWRWKPSEEQLLSLKFIINNYPDYVYNADLESLYEDLKKL